MRTIAYASYPNVDPNLTSLDIYTPPGDVSGCTGRPIVVWVHGGGWTSGDKGEYMADKVSLFNGAGYVFASVNYRLTDKNLAFPHHNIRYTIRTPPTPFRGSSTMRSSSVETRTRSRCSGTAQGGGIVAALATDERYLGNDGVSLRSIGCVGSMDGEGYDIVAGATTSPPDVQVGYRNAFGSDPGVWEQASPVRHVAPNKGIPSYFVAARGNDWRFAQHLAFIDALRTAGVPTTVLDATTLEHIDLTTQIGAPGDTLVTPALMSFLVGCFAPTTALDVHWLVI